MREQVLVFGKTNSLVGIVIDPPKVESNNHLPAIIFLNAQGVHRVGPNRLYVKMARTLAAMGFVTLRFDFSGSGDSEIRADSLLFKRSIVEETQEAMNHLSAAKGIERFILIGIHSGAMNSLKAACNDPRVLGVILINTTGYGGKALNSYVTNYRLARIYREIGWSSLRGWLRIITGKSNYRNMLRVVGFHLRRAFTRDRKAIPKTHDGTPDLRTDLCLLARRGAHLLLIHSRGDPSLDYLQAIPDDEIRGPRSRGTLRVEIIPQADPTLTLLRTQEHLCGIVQDWVRAMS
jgi:hypothetical protein